VVSDFCDYNKLVTTLSLLAGLKKITLKTNSSCGELFNIFIKFDLVS
jgi:hypothetical protein